MTLNMINSGVDTGRYLGCNFGIHLEFGILQPWHDLFIVRNELLVPKYQTLDTKIIVLGGIVTEIGIACDFDVHVGSHLDFLA